MTVWSTQNSKGVCSTYHCQNFVLMRQNTLGDKTLRQTVLTLYDWFVKMLFAHYACSDKIYVLSVCLSVCLPVFLWTEGWNATSNQPLLYAMKLIIDVKLFHHNNISVLLRLAQLLNLHAWNFQSEYYPETGGFDWCFLWFSLVHFG